MSQNAPTIHDLQARGVDARAGVSSRVDERRVLVEESAQSKAEARSESGRFFLVVGLLVLAAIGAVVAVIGPGQFF